VGAELWEEIYEAFSNLRRVLDFLRMFGVLTVCDMRRENIVKLMITGYKIAKRHGDVQISDWPLRTPTSMLILCVP